MSIRMPVLLGLTIRSAKKKKPAPKIPSGPMFHDDSTSGPEEDSANLEGQEENQNKNAISVISGNVIQETSF